MLEESAAANIPIDITVVIALLRQLLPAVALFGRHNRDAAIGTISAHRLIVTPQSRLVIAEHAFGPAIEKLNLGRDKLWRDFGVSMPPSAGLPRANQRADAMGVGVVALTLLLGRSLEVDEFPSQLQDLVDGAQEYRAGQRSPLSVGVFELAQTRAAVRRHQRVSDAFGSAGLVRVRAGQRSLVCHDVADVYRMGVAYRHHDREQAAAQTRDRRGVRHRSRNIRRATA